MTLALLITAATGAWAQTETLLAEITPANYADYSDIVTINQSDGGCGILLSQKTVSPSQQT